MPPLWAYCRCVTSICFGTNITPPVFSLCPRTLPGIILTRFVVSHVLWWNVKINKHSEWPSSGRSTHNKNTILDHFVCGRKQPGSPPSPSAKLWRREHLIRLKHVSFMFYFPKAGRSFIENTSHSIECAINQHNHGDNVAVWGGVSNNSLRPLKGHLSHQSNDFLSQRFVQGPPRDLKDQGQPRNHSTYF